MTKSISTAVKRYIRSAVYVFLTVLLFALTNKELSESFSKIQYFEMYIQAALQIGLVGYAVFALLSYEYMYKVRFCGMQESLQVIPGAQAKLFIAQILLLVVLLVAWCGNVFVWLIKGYQKYEITYAAMMKNTVLSAILYLFMPGLVAICLGALLALKTNRGVAYAVIVLFSFLCSSVPIELWYYPKVLGIQVSTVLEWFCLYVPNTTWWADVSYGTPVEACRWVLVFFWILLFSTGIYRKIGKEGKMKSACVLGLAALTLLCGVRYYGRHDDSYLCKDRSPDDLFNAEWNYRENEPELEEQWANFAVSKYNIDLTIKNNTKGDVYLELSENNLTEYIFTMHHGFEIKSIKDGDGKKLEYTRVSDFITVKSDKPLTQLHFTYQGHAGKYYSNSQGIALPGYLPYYPVPGHFKIWDEKQNGYLCNTERNTSYYELTVHSNLNVACNLKETGKNTFAGEAQTISLYAGLMEKYTEGGITYWCSPLDKKTPNLDDFQAEWEALTGKLGIDEPFVLDEMVFFVQPYTVVSSNFVNEVYAEFSDHIILENLSDIAAKPLCGSKVVSLIPEHEGTKHLQSAFENYIVYYSYEFNIPYGKEVAWETIEKLSVNSEDNSDSKMEAVMAMRDLFFYKLRKHGDDMLKEVYAFLLNPSGDGVEFLYNLGVEQ